MKHPGSLYGLEEELFPEPRKDKGSGWWKWALAMVLGSLFVYRSTRPVMRLSADPPPSFYDYNRTWDQQERQHEKRVAQAYWHVAVQRIQTDYSPSSPLPEDPPPQFKIAEAARSLEADMVASRIHYWYRLRDVWSQRDAWDVSYGWNTDWLDSTLNSLPQYIPQWVANIFQVFINLFNDIAQRIPFS
ncbi:MAG TPA: hypothetical protein VMW54_07025 [Terriglobia bacterium]|nr:hypothetical protein [Terriglobia bacterium]